MANDVTILSGLIAFFLILAVAVPVVQEEFNQDVSTYDSDDLTEYADEPDTGWFSSSFSKIITNMYTLLIWTFGVPWWINLTFLLMLRMVMAFLIYRAIRSGAG